MKLPANVLYEQLSKAYSFQIQSQSPGTWAEGIYFFEPGRCQEHCVYILSGNEYLSYHSEFQSAVLLVTDPLPEFPDCTTDNDVLIFSETVNISQLFNDISSIFHQYYCWSEQLSQCVFSFEGIKKMMDLTHHFKHCAFILADMNFHYLYYTNDFLQYHFLTADHLDSLAPEITELLVQDSGYRQSFGKRDVFYFPDYEYAHPALCLNLFASSSYPQARLMLLNPAHSYSAEEYFVLYQLGERIEHILEIIPPHSFPLKIYESFRAQILLLLEGKLADSKALLRMLPDLGWLDGDSYVVYAICPQTTWHHTALHHICCYLELLAPGTFAIVRGNEICLLMNTRISNPADMESSLQELTKMHPLCIGKSPSFKNICGAGYGWETAKAAVTLGTARTHEESFFPFDQYALDYLLENGHNHLPAGFLAHPAVLAFAEHDRTRHTEYIKTLSAYLEENCSPTRTARRLFIHRSSLIERIEKMDFIASLTPLNDFRGRLHIMISLELLKDASPQ